jgi:stage III sporulation protein AC
VALLGCVGRCGASDHPALSCEGETAALDRRGLFGGNGSFADKNARRYRIRISQNLRGLRWEREAVNGFNVDLLFRIAGIGIFISVLNIVLKQAGKEEQAQMLTLVGVVVVLLMVIQLINELFLSIKTIFNLF